MRWALIVGGAVANVVEQPDQPGIPGQWVACGIAGPGWSYAGGNFTAPPAPPAPPLTVTMRQARLALHAAGKLTEVEAAINAMTEPDRTRARIAWDYSSVLERTHPLVAQLGPAIGLSEAQIDALFESAAGIP